MLMSYVPVFVAFAVPAGPVSPPPIFIITGVTSWVTGMSPLLLAWAFIVVLLSRNEFNCLLPAGVRLIAFDHAGHPAWRDSWRIRSVPRSFQATSTFRPHGPCTR